MDIGVVWALQENVTTFRSQSSAMPLFLDWLWVGFRTPYLASYLEVDVIIKMSDV